MVVADILCLTVEWKFWYLVDFLVPSMALGTKNTLNTCMYHGREFKDKPLDIGLEAPPQFFLLDVIDSVPFLELAQNLGQRFWSPTFSPSICHPYHPPQWAV